jgi:hypothetical protein
MREQTDGIATLIRCNGDPEHDGMGRSQRRRPLGSIDRPSSPFGPWLTAVTVEPTSKGLSVSMARIAGHPENICLFL